MQSLPAPVTAFCLLLLAPVSNHGFDLHRAPASEFNYRLFINTHDLILVDPTGSRLNLNTETSTIIEAVSRTNEETTIQLSNGTQLVFYGSYLVEHTDTNGVTEKINYRNSQSPGKLNCDTPEVDSNNDCNSTEPFDFDIPLIADATTQIDIRPPNCNSYFDDYLHTRRGLQIEQALADHFQLNGFTATPQTFPVIDFIENNTAHIVKSRDLSKAAFQSDNALYDQIMLDIQEIDTMFNDTNSLSAHYQGRSMTIQQNQIQRSVLNIVIQNGLATEPQKQQLQRVLTELEQRTDVTINIIEIP
jgi:hypothetical protein